MSYNFENYNQKTQIHYSKTKFILNFNTYHEMAYTEHFGFTSTLLTSHLPRISGMAGNEFILITDQKTI